jgi:predicted NBD/HSP70 family sugar kinase
LLRVPGVPNTADVARLLTINGVSALFGAHIAGLRGDSKRRYAGIAATTSARERVYQILANASAAMPVCEAIVREQIKVLAVAIANMVLLVQPDVIVIGGLLSALSPDLFLALESAIRRQIPALIGNNTLIQQGRLATHSSAAIGANHHFLQVYLSEGNTLV